MQEQLKIIRLKGLSEDEFDILKFILNAHAFRLLDIHWKKSVAWHTDFRSGSIVFEYE
jgi:hypothetical protein